MYLLKIRPDERLYEGSLKGIEELNPKVHYMLWKDERCCGRVHIFKDKVQLDIGYRNTPIIFNRKEFEEAYEKDVEFFDLLKTSPNLVWIEAWNKNGQFLEYGTQEDSSEVDFDFFSSPALHLMGKEISYQYGCRY